MTEGRRAPNGYGEVALVEYRLLSPDLWEPPRNHKRIAEGEYVGPYEPRLDLLDELGIIRVSDWGDA